MRGGGVQNCSANLLQIQRNEAQITLSHLLGLGACVPMCVGGFFLPGYDMPSSGPWPQERRSLACSHHQSPGGGEKDDSVQDRVWTRSYLTT